MHLVPIYSPQTESEMVAIVSLLDAHGIPHFVHNAGFGSLYPGMQVGLYNVRTIMVPPSAALLANELLVEFIRPPAPANSEMRTSWRSKARLVLEALLFGWIFPETRHSYKKTLSDDDVL